MMALTRQPSGKRASTIGDVSSTRRPTFDTMRSMICIRWSLSRNLTSRLLHLAAAFDVDLVRPVDEDVADGRVLEQHLQRAEAERLVEHLVDEALALHAVEQRVFGVAQPLDDEADLAAQRVAFQVADPRQVELIDQLAVDEPFQFLEALGALAGRRRPAGRTDAGWGRRRCRRSGRSDRVASVTSVRTSQVSVS